GSSSPRPLPRLSPAGRWSATCLHRDRSPTPAGIAMHNLRRNYPGNHTEYVRVRIPPADCRATAKASDRKQLDAGQVQHAPVPIRWPADPERSPRKQVQPMTSEGHAKMKSSSKLQLLAGK